MSQNVIRVFRVFQIAVLSGGGVNSPQWRESEICGGGFFYQVVRTWGGVILTIQTFLKAKNSILQHSVNTEPLIKIKISMTCVSKEYKIEIKIKMVQEQWRKLEMTFLVGYNLKIWRGGGFFQVGEWANFLVGETLPIPPVGKTLVLFTTEQV